MRVFSVAFAFVSVLVGAPLSVAFSVRATTTPSARVIYVRQPTNAWDLHATATDNDVTSPSEASAEFLKQKLLDLIPKRRFGAPATNVTTNADIVAQIELVVSSLEAMAPLPPLVNSTVAVETLNGAWQLLYSNAPEITRIEKLPLGFRLGPVFQPINVTDGRLENQAFIRHKFWLASGFTRVLANFSLALPLGEINRVGVANTGSRANVKFNKVLFNLQRFLVLPTFGTICKTAIPNGPAEKQGVIPSIDVTYLDDDLRISRGGDGSLFVLVRANKLNKKQKRGQQQPKPLVMLTMDPAEIVVDEKAPTYDASKDILPSGVTTDSS